LACLDIGDQPFQGWSLVPPENPPLSYSVGNTVQPLCFCERMKAAQASRWASTVKRMLASLNRRDLVIGVDRLDYSKGLKQRMEAFATFLERCRRRRGRA
jgi:hypothetical protein